MSNTPNERTSLPRVPSTADRPTWDAYFMALAHLTAARATCPRRAVGAVLVVDRRIIATGYNGAPRGLDHCPTDDAAGDPSCMRHGHCVRTIHAEVNAVIACAAAGVSTTGATLYATTCPCPACMGVLINAGIKEVQYAAAYTDPSHVSDLTRESLQLGLLSRVRMIACAVDWFALGRAGIPT